MAKKAIRTTIDPYLYYLTSTESLKRSCTIEWKTMLRNIIYCIPPNMVFVKATRLSMQY